MGASVVNILKKLDEKHIKFEISSDYWCGKRAFFVKIGGVKIGNNRIGYYAESDLLESLDEVENWLENQFKDFYEPILLKNKEV